MITHHSLLVIVFCFLVSILVGGCALYPSSFIPHPLKTPPSVDIKTVGDSIVNARESVALARNEGAPEHAPQEFAKALALLKEAQEKLRKGKSSEAADLAFQTDIEARIAAALAREAKANRRIEEASHGRLEVLWEAKIDEVDTAKVRQAIAEKMTVEAQKEVEIIRATADREIQKAKVEIAIAKAELEIGSADQTKASEYAKETYDRAVSSLQTAKSALAAEDSDNAITSAQVSAKYASNALVEAKAKLEAEARESLIRRDRAVAAIAKAELSIEEAKGVEAFAVQYAKDMYEKAGEMLKEAMSAMEAEDYDRAASLAEQARTAASNARAVAKTKEMETRAKEAQEDARANALDAVAKAERAEALARSAGTAELADVHFKQAMANLDQARQAMLEENFSKANSLAQQSIYHSTAALATVQAQKLLLEQRGKIEEIENNIIKEAGRIPETAVRKTDRGVVISMGDDLFARGSSQIRNEAQGKLKMLAALLKKYPDYKIIIEGHTDSSGKEDSNLKASTERANNLLRYMVDREGVPMDRLSSAGYGSSRPIAPNETEDGRKQNRRMDVVILTAPISPQ